MPIEERESVDAGIRQVEFLDAEIAAAERLIAQQALSWPEIRRLMTVPGVNLVCAASFIAAIGHANRFMTSRKLVAYLGLDPKVRQSGEAPARSGRISKRGSASARWALVEAAWSAVLQPGPLHAFYARTRDRRGHGKAIVATARKLTILFWCMLTRSQDYAHQQPSLTKKKLRRSRSPPAPRNTPGPPPGSGTNDMVRDAERELAQQAEISYQRMVTDQKAGGPAREGRGRDTGARINEALEGQSCAADHKLLTSALRFVSHPRLPNNLTPHTHSGNPRRNPALRKYRANTATNRPGPETGPTEDVLRPPRPDPDPSHPRNPVAPDP